MITRKRKSFLVTLIWKNKDLDYNHTKKICKDFKIKHFGEYHDLHLKSDTLLLADVFENFRKMYLKMN